VSDVRGREKSPLVAGLSQSPVALADHALQRSRSFVCAPSCHLRRAVRVLPQHGATDRPTICAIPAACDSCSLCVPLLAPGEDSMISRMTTHLARELLSRATFRAYHGTGGRAMASAYK
jgi:hypothetical protein